MIGYFCMQENHLTKVIECQHFKQWGMFMFVHQNCQSLRSYWNVATTPRWRINLMYKCFWIRYFCQRGLRCHAVWQVQWEGAGILYMALWQEVWGVLALWLSSSINLVPGWWGKHDIRKRRTDHICSSILLKEMRLVIPWHNWRTQRWVLVGTMKRIAINTGGYALRLSRIRFEEISRLPFKRKLSDSNGNRSGPCCSRAFNVVAKIIVLHFGKGNHWWNHE